MGYLPNADPHQLLHQLQFKVLLMKRRTLTLLQVKNMELMRLITVRYGLPSQSVDFMHTFHATFSIASLYLTVHGDHKLMNDCLFKHTLSFKQKSPILLSLRCVVCDDIIPY